MSNSAYKKAGVDIDAGNALVQNIKPAIAKTQRSGCMGGVGGFGALFDVKQAGYEDPILVSATDGVGTKLKVAIEAGRHDTVGQDLVAMCVNDLVVQGAEPLFFLDYFASGKLDVAQAQEIIEGIAKGCELAGCALIGGETAEMPGMYAAGDYDLAGFAVGAVERDQIIDGGSIAEGDVVIGLPSSGLHSNGYSLVRKIVEQEFGATGQAYNTALPFEPDHADHMTLANALLCPTKIYTKSLVSVFKNNGLGHKVKGLSHITGGGLLENIPRILPDNMAVHLDADNWKIHNIFKWLSGKGVLGYEDMALTFNCGIGMVLICAEHDAVAIMQELQNVGEYPTLIGSVISMGDAAHLESDISTPQVVISNIGNNWDNDA